MLQADESGQTLIELAVCTLFAMERDSLMLDDKVIPKPFTAAMEGLISDIASLPIMTIPSSPC